MKPALFLILILFPLLAGASRSDPCPNDDPACLQVIQENHPVKKDDFWQRFSGKPLHERVFVAPPELIEFVELDNRRNGFPNRPFRPDVPEDFIRDIQDAIAELPGSVKRKLDTKFTGVFLLSDLGGTGYTDYILDDAGQAVSGFVILDYRVLRKRNANEWATWKESTPFKSDPSYAIEAIIQPAETDTRKYAIQYILLHELGHVISVNELFHPPWNVYPKDVQQVGKYRFFNESWRIERHNNRFVSRFDADVLPDRPRVVYYFGARLDGDRMAGIYSDLERTDFPTLYAATHPGEDWAESFVTYVHSVLMNKPFAIRIRKDGEVVKHFDLCWGTPRCARKEAFLKALFGSAP